MADPVLELSTVIERPTVIIDGGAYQILSPDELPVVDQHRFAAWGRRIEKLRDQDELSEDERDELRSIVRALSDEILIGVPETVCAKLNEAHRVAVIETFSLIPLGRRVRRLTAALPRTSPSNGERRSPAPGPSA